jgi:hypothetical protein
MAAHSEICTHQIKKVLALDGPEFLGQAYLLMLGRPIDPEGFRYYGAKLHAGASKLLILAKLRASQEGKAYRANAPDLLTLFTQALGVVASPAPSVQRLLRMNESSFVDRAYFALAGRWPDDSVRRRYLARLTSGTSRLRILLEMLEAGEGRSAASAVKGLEAVIGHLRSDLSPVAVDVEELLAFDDVAFVDCAYKTLLGRAPDADGLDHYVQLIRSGASKARIVAALCLSAEGRARTSSLLGLRRAMRQYRLARGRLTGWWYRPIARVEGESPLECRLRAVENSLKRIAWEREREAKELDAVVDEITRSIKEAADRGPA